MKTEKIKGTKFYIINANGVTILGDIEAVKKIAKNILDGIRQSIEDENISYGEIAELQSIAKYIDKSDVRLLEIAGVKEKI